MPTYNGTIQFYNDFREQLGKGVHDLSSHTLKMLLVDASYNFDAAHSVLADVNGELSGNGYARATLANVQWTESSGVGKLDFDDPQFAAAGGSLVARRWIVFNDTPSSPDKPLIASGLLDATDEDVTVTDGNMLTYVVPAQGFFSLTAA